MTVQSIHLALQGGGAKFFCLVAALAELQVLEKDNKIKVVSIAGTSAGAIAGALYAARIPMLEVYEWLQKPARASLIARIPKTFILPKLLLGIPLISPKLLDEVLGELFRLGKGDRQLDLGHEKIADFNIDRDRIPFKSFYTDLENNALRQHAPEVFLRTALLESAGLPFVFRTYRSKNPGHVDGGICENLPATFLLNDDNVPVVAIAFRDTAHPKGGLLSYAISLLFTAIDHSVSRAKAALGSAGRVLEIQSTIGTLDFQKILGCAQNPEFDRIRYNSRRFFERLTYQETGRQVEAQITPSMPSGHDIWVDCQRDPRWGRAYANYMLGVGEIYNAQWGMRKLSGTLARLEFHLTQNEQGQAELIKMKYVRVFTGYRGPMHVTKVQLFAPRSDHIGEQEVVLYKKNEPLAFGKTPIYLSAQDQTQSANRMKRPLLVWPLTNEAGLLGEFILEVTTPGKGLMPRLSNGGIEELIIDTSEFGESVQSVEVYVVGTEALLQKLEFFTLDKAEYLGYEFERPDMARIHWKPSVLGDVHRLSQADAVLHANMLDVGLGATMGMSRSLVRWHSSNVPPSTIVGMLMRQEA